MGFHRHAVRQEGRPLNGAPFDLRRFVEAQAPVWPHVLSELRAGRKQSHWMWFVFPQIAGLGHSTMAQHFAIASRAEARAYLDHAVLGPRLLEVTGWFCPSKAAARTQIFGSPDDLKFRSSMTLFDAVAPNGIFAAALEEILQRRARRGHLGEASRITINAFSSEALVGAVFPVGQSPLTAGRCPLAGLPAWQADGGKKKCQMACKPGSVPLARR